MHPDQLHIRHDLRTSLNHIVGYCDILLEDTREYRRNDLSPGIEQILAWADKLKRLISFYYDKSNDSSTFNSQEVKQAFYTPLTQIISDARRLIVLFRQKAPSFVKDMEQLLSVSIQMYNLIEAQVVDIEIPPAPFNTTNSQNLMPDHHKTPLEKADSPATGLPEFVESEYEDSLLGERAVMPAHILVVDDSYLSQELISRHLRALGHTVTIASSGFEGLKILKGRHSIDIVILDFLMPQISGLQVLKTLKENPDTRELPVIMMSAIENPASIAQCIKLGAEDYLPKDFDSVILRARIEACLEKQRLHQQQFVFINALIESQKALARELSDAARYVVSLLPKPLHGGIQSTIALVPSADLGGDFSAHHWLSETELSFYVLDVSGHGIKAALQAVSISNLIKNQALPDTDFTQPAQVLASLNICNTQETQNNSFFAIWYGVLDTRTKVLTYASAGSPPAIITRKRDVLQLSTKGLLLGASNDTVFKQSSIQVLPEDKLFLFSDGIYEASRPDNSVFGLDEFIKLLPNQDKTPNLDAENLLTTVLGMTMRDNFDDDVCLFVMQVME